MAELPIADREAVPFSSAALRWTAISGAVVVLAAGFG
jgi:hypothetical protein